MKIGIIILFWLFSAFGVGLSQILGSIPPPAIQGIILGLTVICVTSFFLADGFRAFISKLFPYGILSFHLIRFIGFYFLYLNSKAKLPSDFAVPAGWGDIIIALLGLMIIIMKPLPNNNKIILGWNILGLIDITFVVVIAAWLNLTRPGELNELTLLPLSLLPTFIVPLIISTHIFVFHQILKNNYK